MAYEPKPLSCNPAKLKGLSEKLIVSHYENNYSGAVKRLNAISAQLEDLEFATAPVFIINGLKREELIASNSMILHELYFDSLGSDGEANKDLRSALVRDFGSMEKWQAQFVAMGKAFGGGSGWVLLTYSHRGKKLINQWAADHTCCLAGASPVLALDMYEHSYHIDYGARAAAYVDVFMSNINWENVSALYQSIHAPKAANPLRV
jgi:superoxide dismutase, Fe-Mn family